MLVYKSSGVFNFAQGEFGTVALYALYLLDFETGYWLAFAGALVAAGLMGFLTERIVVRPLFDAPRVTLLVATAGVALLAIGIEIWFGSAQGKPIAKGFDRVDRVERARRADLRPAAAGSSPPWPCWPSCSGCSSPAPTSAWRSSAPARSRRRPSSSASACAGCRRFTWVLAALLGGLAALHRRARRRQLRAGDHDDDVPHPGVHGRRARRA